MSNPNNFTPQQFLEYIKLIEEIDKSYKQQQKSEMYRILYGGARQGGKRINYEYYRQQFENQTFIIDDTAQIEYKNNIDNLKSNEQIGDIDQMTNANINVAEIKAKISSNHKRPFRDNHIIELYRHLRRTYPNVQQDAGGTWTPQDANNIDTHTEALAHMARVFILACYSDNAIANAHRNVVAGYRTRNQKVKITEGRGRPIGATNKPKMNFDTGKVEINLEDIVDVSNDHEANKAWVESINSEDRKDNVETPINADLREYAKIAYVDKITYEINKNVFDCQEKIAETEDVLERNVADILKRIEAINLARPTIVEIKQLDGVITPLEGVQHRRFPLLLKAIQARKRNGHPLNFWVFGPAGTGKSMAGEKVAQAMGLNFYTNNKMADEHQVIGYKDGAGQYHTTQFRLAYENGGIYLADEIDGSHPGALLALNNALANGGNPFPDKFVKRHKDFVFIGAANTVGHGATHEYVGRMKQDAAFKDRFEYIHWPHDDAMEDALVANKPWLTYVREVRRKLALASIKDHLVTMRASISGEALLSAGIDPQDVIEMCLIKGLSQAQWQQIKPAGDYFG